MKHPLLSLLFFTVGLTHTTDQNPSTAKLPAAAQAEIANAGARMAPNKPIPRLATKEELIGDKCHRLLNCLAAIDGALRTKRQLALEQDKNPIKERNLDVVNQNNALIQQCQRLCEQLNVGAKTDWNGLKAVLNGTEPISALRGMVFKPTQMMQELKKIIKDLQSILSDIDIWPTFIPISQSDIGTGACGYTISSPGSYRLVEDINYTSTGAGTAICIESSYVTLDLDGHTLTVGDVAITAQGIEIRNNNTHGHIAIKNGTVYLNNPSGNAYGIYLYDLTNVHRNVHISDVAVHNNVIDQAVSGIYLRAPLDAALIEHSRITGHFNNGINISQRETANPYCVEVSNSIVAIKKATTSTGSCIGITNSSSETSNAISIAKNNLCIGLDITYGFFTQCSSSSLLTGNIVLNTDVGYRANVNGNVPYLNNYANANSNNYSDQFGSLWPSTTEPYDFSLDPTTAKYWTNIGIGNIPSHS